MSAMDKKNHVSESLNVELNNLRLQSLLCDITITDESERTLQAHSVVLAAGIHVLKNVFTMKQSQDLIRNQGLTIKVRGVNIELWNVILDYVYLRSLTLSIPIDILIQLYQVAKMLDIRSLVSNLEKSISNLGLELSLPEDSASVHITLAPTKYAEVPASKNEQATAEERKQQTSEQESVFTGREMDDSICSILENEFLNFDCNSSNSIPLIDGELSDMEASGDVFGTSVATASPSPNPKVQCKHCKLWFDSNTLLHTHLKDYCRKIDVSVSMVERNSSTACASPTVIVPVYETCESDPILPTDCQSTTDQVAHVMVGESDPIAPSDSTTDHVTHVMISEELINNQLKTEAYDSEKLADGAWGYKCEATDSSVTHVMITQEHVNPIHGQSIKNCMETPAENYDVADVNNELPDTCLDSSRGPHNIIKTETQDSIEANPDDLQRDVEVVSNRINAPPSTMHETNSVLLHKQLNLEDSNRPTVNDSVGTGPHIGAEYHSETLRDKKQILRVSPDTTPQPQRSVGESTDDYRDTTPQSQQSVGDSTDDYRDTTRQSQQSVGDSTDDYRDTTPQSQQSVGDSTKDNFLTLRTDGEQSLRCLNTNCQESFNTNLELSRHMRNCLLSPSSFNVLDHTVVEDQTMSYVHDLPLVSGAITRPSAQSVKLTRNGKQLVYRCCHCKFEASKDKMALHLAAVHAKHKAFHCNQCDAKYGYFETLRDHYVGEHSHREYPCEQCDMTFRKKESLRRHTLGVHKRNGYGVHYCRGCGKGFRYSSHARRHESYHLPTEERRSFVCAVCKKAFLSKQDLYRHSKIHDKQKKYQCSKCNYTGLRKFDVVIHERKHGIMHGKYACITCGRYFLTEFRFRQHMKTYGHEGTQVQLVDMTRFDVNSDDDNVQENMETELQVSPNEGTLDTELQSSLGEQTLDTEIRASLTGETHKQYQFIVLAANAFADQSSIKSETATEFGGMPQTVGCLELQMENVKVEGKG